MTIQLAILCDAATDYNGKLNILGTFDTIYSQQFPAVHPLCAVALRVVFTKGDEGQRALKVNFVDEDGKSLMPPIDMPVDIAMSGDSTFVSRNFVINIQGLKFDQPGMYGIDIAVDGRHETSIPLAVKKAQQG